MAEEGTGGAGRAHFLVKVGDLSLSVGTWVMVDEGAGGALLGAYLIDGEMEENAEAASNTKSNKSSSAR
eukprot:CAMPEP_0178675788 /NCGR_PEP_ID=MMETSP0698-20121128/35572_1 /TAXON_ID=265572 /ORGANISM="Extubocellulus spinifer, Strain CCMP396" /LENGTH=68 /DNA_ID=CAMNT_0020319989 /DNA_START=359 /DNA_END=566 /DNA_ORIENTATION=-